MSERVYDKIIIGGGAAGLMAAYSACCVNRNANEKPDVLILEANDVCGKKITATGNGKCNFTNTFQSEECYRSNDSKKAFDIIKSFDQNETIKFFESIGVYHTERNGYCYPYGEQARTLRDVLVLKVESLGTEIHYKKKVSNIEKKDKLFYLRCSDNRIYACKKVIITAGGAAQPIFGNDSEVYNILSSLGLKIVKPRPALCGLLSYSKWLKNVEGVRIKCGVSLVVGEKSEVRYSERGEIIFNKKGISGIPIMNLSRFAIHEYNNGNNPRVVLDFFPDMKATELKEYLCSVAYSSGTPIGPAFSALINDKLLKLCFNSIDFDFDTKAVDSDSRTMIKKLGMLADKLKNFEVSISGDAGFENAQTTQGGVSLKEIDERSMECLKYQGMYLAGEVLDVDGMCGGYNLQWAWTTGYLAGKN